MVDLQTYARQRGISVDTVRRRIRFGELQAIREGNKLFIPEENEDGKKEVSEATLKKIRLQLQIKQAQEELKESVYANFLMWAETLKEVGIEACAEYSKKVSDLNLPKETVEKLNEAFSECILQICQKTSERLQKRLYEREQG